MALLKIARMGHPVLHRIADPVIDPGSLEIRCLVNDMIETMLDARGAGLAAPQVHRALRMFVYHVPAHRAAGDEKTVEPRVLINPEILPIGEEMVVCTEGCLSIPGLRADVLRYARVFYRGVDRDGVVIEGEAGGFHANVLQHENDHLDGILYPQKITDFSRFGYVEEMMR